ncbi:MAG: chemotaxis protein CheW [Polyangiaceae bacterium]
MTTSNRALLFRIGPCFGAVALASVAETMRPLPIDPLPDLPDFVLGVSVIRGVPTPVVDGAALFSIARSASPFARFITLKVDGRSVALAVDEISGIQELPALAADFPPLLRDATDGVVQAIGNLDARLLVVLRDARIVPASVWEAIRARSALS